MQNGINNYENKMLLETYFSGRFDIVPETILIVVGTWIGSERYDRTLAMSIKRIFLELNIESDIITDVYYAENRDKFNKNHLIFIGYSNKVTQDYEKKKIFGLNRNETTSKTFNEDGRQIAFVYGRGVKETYEATIKFCNDYLTTYLDIWSDKYTKNRKNIKIPKNLDDILKNIIYTPIKSVSNDSSKELFDEKMKEIENKLNRYKFSLIISSSISLAMFIFWITFYKLATDFWVSLGISLTVLFGITTVYSIYPFSRLNAKIFLL